MILDMWARKWGVTPEAIADLRSSMITVSDFTPSMPRTAEAAAQAEIRYEASTKGFRLWRNNVGVAKTEKGVVRFGIANDSAAVNQRIKSADCIGIRPVLITAKHVGMVIGQFVSREVKRPGWKFKGTTRENAQLKWAELIISMGGDASFATGKGTL